MSEAAQADFVSPGGVKHIRWDEVTKERLDRSFDRELVHSLMAFPDELDVEGSPARTMHAP